MRKTYAHAFHRSGRVRAVRRQHGHDHGQSAITLQRDQIVTVGVLAADTAGLDDILAQLPGTGITEANLTGVFGAGNLVTWSFSLAAPLAQSGAIKAVLAQLEQKNGAVSFNVVLTQISQALPQSQPCSQASLVSDAQSQAQNLAAPAGYSVGPVLAVSDGSGLPETAPAALFSSLGTGVTISNLLVLTTYNAAPASPANCTAVVKFQLYSYH